MKSAPKVSSIRSNSHSIGTLKSKASPAPELSKSQFISPESRYPDFELRDEKPPKSVATEVQAVRT